jgi:hypothetical protein
MMEMASLSIARRALREHNRGAGVAWRATLADWIAPSFFPIFRHGIRGATPPPRG